MKKLLSLLLPLALALSLAACGEKSADEAARQTPPTLTVTSANACSVTLKSSSYDWTYTQGLQSMTAIACGAHPLDENCRDITPVLEMPFAVSAAYFYTVTLDFGDNSPDSVSLTTDTNSILYVREIAKSISAPTQSTATIQPMTMSFFTALFIPFPPS